MFEQFARTVSKYTGKAGAFALAFGTCLVWAATGPVFHFSDTWQLVINTGTTIVTFLMVFLDRAESNRAFAAVQGKLDELLRAGSASRNQLIGLEELSSDEIEQARSWILAQRSKA